MPVSVDTGPAPRALAAPVRALVMLALRLESRRAGEIGVRITDDAELRALNRRWRRIDRATDVISFAYEEDHPDAATRPVTGDVVLSLARARAQARRFRVGEGAELARLVVHGVLHLAGHDHARAPERRAMRAREHAVLGAAGAIVRRLEAARRAPRRDPV
jgi:probable rRNA maturation factor